MQLFLCVVIDATERNLQLKELSKLPSKFFFFLHFQQFMTNVLQPRHHHRDTYQGIRRVRAHI